MKKNTKLRVALIMSAGLGLTCIDASAAALDRESSLIFNTQGATTFSYNIAGSFTDFNNRFTFSTAGRDGNFAFAADPTGPSFDSFQNSYRQHLERRPEQYNGKPHMPDIGDREINQHEWNRDEGHAVSPVPEPAEYILMCCGLALFGFVANRRRNCQGFAAD